ncbi:GNAT family protein [Malaciobacter marinus]|uniref:hypothetical protein n=1 Tax=Malaciobacter marinus TaxID=505249 RepID=UPI0010565759|nr:hypothetical protein [Malaciobacter marinus]
MQIINYNKSYSKQIPELFTNSIHKTCNKEYTKEQLNAWAKLDIDYEAWEKRLDKTKPYLAIHDKKLVGFQSSMKIILIAFMYTMSIKEKVLEKL